MNIKRKFKSIEKECPNCKSLLEVFIDDIIVSDVGLTEYCNCTVCNKIIQLQTEIPKDWKHELYKNDVF